MPLSPNREPFKLRPPGPGGPMTFSTTHLAAPSFVPRNQPSPSPPQAPLEIYEYKEAEPYPKSEDGAGYGQAGPSSHQQMHLGVGQGEGEGVGVGGYAVDTRQLNHHLHSSPLPHTSNLPLSHLPLHSFFLPPDLRLSTLQRLEARLVQNPVTDPGLPKELHVYGGLHELLTEQQEVVLAQGQGLSSVQGRERVFGFRSDVYRADCRLDGRIYCLRRVEGFKLAKEAAFGVLDKWRRIRHPNIVSVREAFTTRVFGDSSVVFAYDYHPSSRTLHETHLTPSLNPATGVLTAPTPIPERLFWSYVAQIANGLKAVHTAGLAARVVEPTKLLLTGKNRVRLNCCAIFDVITFESAATNLHFQQQDDLLNFGKLLVSLCLGSTSAVHTLATSLETIGQNYTPDAKLVILYLLGKPGPGKCVDDILVMLGPRLLNEFDAMQNYADGLETALEAEVENGRVARLLMKLGFINERPEFQMDPRWSETGDRYVLKLFRDFIFHSVDEVGAPVLDLSHVLTALNKTDAGLNERIMLISRDDQSCVVVSYAELRNCIESAYGELVQAGKAGYPS